MRLHSGVILPAQGPELSAVTQVEVYVAVHRLRPCEKESSCQAANIFRLLVPQGLRGGCIFPAW